MEVNPKRRQRKYGHIGINILAVLSVACANVFHYIRNACMSSINGLFAQKWNTNAAEIMVQEEPQQTDEKKIEPENDLEGETNLFLRSAQVALFKCSTSEEEENTDKQLKEEKNEGTWLPRMHWEKTTDGHQNIPHINSKNTRQQIYNEERRRKQRQKKQKQKYKIPDYVSKIFRKITLKVFALGNFQEINWRGQFRAKISRQIQRTRKNNKHMWRQRKLCKKKQKCIDPDFVPVFDVNGFQIDKSRIANIGLKEPPFSCSIQWPLVCLDFPVDRDILLFHEASDDVQFPANSFPLQNIAKPFLPLGIYAQLPPAQVNLSGSLRNKSTDISDLRDLKSDDLFGDGRSKTPTERDDVIVGAQVALNIRDSLLRHESQNEDEGVPSHMTVCLNSNITLCNWDHGEQTQMFLRRNTPIERGLIYFARIIGDFKNWDGNFQEERQFKQKRKLGEGTYGHVYHCETIETEKEPFRFAMKFIDKAKFNENEVLVPLLHGRPGGCRQCLQLYGVLVDPLKITVIMELAEGGTLGDQIHRDPDNTGEATRVKEMTYQLLLGLAYFHDHNVALYDIKPQNIAFRIADDCLSVFYIDHGSVKDLDDAANRNYENGTKIFYPPERHIQLNYPNLKAHDVWTLGCSIQSYVIGKYVDTRLGKFNVADCMKEVKCPKLEDLLSWMLHKYPNRRCTVQEALSHNVFDEIKQQEESRRRCF